MTHAMFARTGAWVSVGVLAWMGCVTSAAAQTNSAAKIAAPQKVTSVEGITEYRLANGMRVLLFPDPSKPTITVNVTVLVGSRHENYGETGMAHLLEHLVFKGTPKNPDIAANFNKRGMRFNGTTSLDRTNYFELFQASDENLEWALQMEADRLVNSYIAKKDLDTEMTVVRNEFENGENSPIGVLLKRMQSMTFDWHNYGNSTIGNRSDIENVEIANLQAFYRRYYQPDNAVLLVAGKFDETKTLAMVQKYFGAIPKPKRELPKLWTVEPTQDGERSFTVRRKGDMQVIALGYRVPSALHDDSNGVGFVNEILTDAPSGRLHKALVESGKAVQVFGFPLVGVDTGLHFVGAVVKQGDAIEPVQTEMIRIVEGLAANPPTAEEMDRTKKAFANDAERVLNNHESIGIQLSEYAALGDWRLFFLGRDQSQVVTAEQVKDAAARYYRRDNRTVGVFIPEDQPLRAEIPTPPTVVAVLKDFKGKEAVATAEAFEPTQENIDKRTKRLKIGGLNVALLRKTNRGETVNVSLRLHTGDEKTLFGQQAAATLAAQMLSRGTTKYTRTQLQDELQRLKVSGGLNGLSADYQTTKPNVAETIRLVAHVLREPSFPADEFAQLKKLLITSLESQRSDPAARAGLAIAQHFNIYPKGDWRYSASLDESLERINALTLDEVKAFHTKFYGADHGELAIVGDYDEAEVVKAITESFANWKTPVNYVRVDSEFKSIAPATQLIETPDKENGVFRARLNINVRDDDPDFPALFLSNYILGGGAGFDSRLTSRIRVKEGLSYGVNSGLSVGPYDRASSWQAQAIAAPQNIEKVEAAFKDELAKALKDGFTAAEVAAAKSGAIQQREQNRAQDRAVASNWTTYLEVGRTFAWSKEFETKLLAAKPEDVLAALRKHIDPTKITIVKAGDFAKVAKGTGAATK